MSDLPHSVGFPLPAWVEAIPPEERQERVHLEGDACEIDGEHFFVRASLQLPVLDGGDALPFFEWGVWVRLGAAAYVRLLDDAGEEAPRPAPGFLASRLPHYDETLDLEVTVHALPGQRPLLVLRDQGHPLTWEQQEGITRERVWEIAQALRQLASGA